MTIVRPPRRHRFTTIDRETVNDERLSFRARGVLAWLLDKPDDWRCESDAIARAGTEGREAIRTALRELEQVGYLERRRVQGEGGRWATIVEVRERPTATDAQESGVGSPGVGSPAVGALGANPPLLRPMTENEVTPAGAGAPGQLFEGTADPVADEEPAADDVAKRVTNAAWEARTPRPTTPWIAARKMVETFLAAGWPPEEVEAALMGAPTWTKGAIEFHLNRARGSRPSTGPRAPVAEHRDAPEGRVAL